MILVILKRYWKVNTARVISRVYAWWCTGLLEIVKPDNLYLGQKDYQQCMVIKKLIELMGLKEQLHLKIISPTLREPDGLAMSSRNMRFSKDERKNATAIYQTLHFIKEQIKKGRTG